MSCGYCNGPLTAYMEPDAPDGIAYRCEPCQPHLAAVKTGGDWQRMIRWRRKVWSRKNKVQAVDA